MKRAPAFVPADADVRDDGADPGVVYFVVADDVRRVKIGRTTHINRRMIALRIGSPVPLRMAGCVIGGRETEAYIQSHFRDYWSHGEWYRLEGELEEFVREHSFDE